MQNIESEKGESASSDEEVEALLANVNEFLLDLALPVTANFLAAVRPLARDLLEELKPQGAMEQMMAVQMIATFGSSLMYSRRATIQKNLQWFTSYSAESNRSMTQFRRQMHAFADLRRPRRTTFTAIRQANIAGQQVVVTQPASWPSELMNQPAGDDGKSIQETAAAVPFE